MSYLWFEEHGLICCPVGQLMNTADDAAGFADWIQDGLTKAKEEKQ